jgi:drug/metabolite transporter (DMT)-like permease
MRASAPDTALRRPRSRPPQSGPSGGTGVASGLMFAVVSATTFGMSGPLARGLLDTGWSAGAVVLARIGIAALLVLPFGAVALRGRWSLLRTNARVIVTYGVLAVAGAQFCYFSAVSRMQVGPALLIEYTAPAAVVIWLWLRHGQRPGPVTFLGAGLAAAGLVLLLDLLSGADLDAIGVLWALAAMVGAASYFLISADASNGLPPLALAAAGLVVGAVVLAFLGAVRVLPMHTAAAPTRYLDRSFAWWAPLVVLGLVTAAIAYCTGIAAGRRLGSRLASFVALLEVVAGVGFSWLLLAELPRPVQLLGGLVILAGVVTVKLGERPPTAPAPGRPRS